MRTRGPAPRIGVLALQGDVREHARLLEALGASVSLVRRPAELAAVDALVLPGGESGVMDRLARAFGLRDPLREAIADGLPVLGTCAGLILLADRLLDGSPGQETFGGLDSTVRRNAFGSQTESFEAELEIPAFGPPTVHVAFIRAPLIEQLGPGATATVTLPDGRIVGAAQGAVQGIAFHPETTGEQRFHRRLLEQARAH